MVPLAVFSPGHLTPFMLVGALVSHVVGEVAANDAARALFLAGIRRPIGLDIADDKNLNAVIGRMRALASAA